MIYVIVCSNFTRFLVLVESDISAVQHLPSNRIEQSVPLFLLAISQQYTLPGLRVKLASLVLWNMSICVASKDSQMIHLWLFTMPCLVWGHALDSFGWTAIL